MKVALIGATGMAGSQILNELLARGHQVTAIVRSPERLYPDENVTAVQADINDTQALILVLQHQQAVISAVHFTEMHIEYLLDALKQAQVPRYLMVGGAGGLKVAGQRLVDSEKFPAAVKPEALAGIAILERLQQSSDLAWTVLAPSMLFRSGERTGKFRLGKDDLLFNDQGESAISTQDYAIALVDELEHPQHIQQRFTVGY